MSDEIKLLSCPFCGSRDVSPVEDQIDEASSTHWVHCEDCGVEGPYKFLPLGHRDEAIAAWNTRAENVELDRLRAENQSLMERLKPLLDEAGKMMVMRAFFKTFPGVGQLLRSAHQHPEHDPDCTYCHLIEQAGRVSLKPPSKGQP